MSYSKREWLNKPESRSTGSVVAFDGYVDYGDGNGLERTMFLEIADCHCKTKLHKTNYDTVDDFIQKIELLQENIEQFINYLKLNRDSKP